MYWNLYFFKRSSCSPRINKKHEMYWNSIVIWFFSNSFWLIETWDVLKCTSPIITAPVRSMINRNMRCIEISAAAAMLRALIRINRNMRCIEINFWMAHSTFDRWINRNMRCIEMIKTVVLPAIAGWINRNMRCIEIDVPYPSWSDGIPD